MKHDFEITVWVISLLPGLYEDDAEGLDKDMRMVVDIIGVRLHAPPIQNFKMSVESIEYCLDTF